MFNREPSSHIPIITCHNLLKRREFKQVQSFVEMNRLVGNEWHELDQAEAISGVLIAAENRLPNGLTDYYGMIRATRLGPVVLDDFLRLMTLLDGRSNRFPCSNEAACYAMEAWTFLSKPDMKFKYDLAISTANMISGQNRQTHVADNRVNNRWGGIGVQGGVHGGTNSGSIGFGGNERLNGNGEFFNGGSGQKSIGGGERGVASGVNGVIIDGNSGFGRIGGFFGGGESGVYHGISGGKSAIFGGGENGVNGKISNGNGGFGRTSGFFGGGRDTAGDRSGKGITGVYHKTRSDDYGLDAIFGGGISVAGGRGRKDISVDGGISSGNNISSGGFNKIDRSFGGSGSKGGVSSGTNGGNVDCNVRFDINNGFSCERGSGFGGVDKEKQKVETVWGICSNCCIMHENEVCMRCNKVPTEFESTTNMIPSWFPVAPEKGEDQYSHLAGMLQSGLPENSSFIPKEQKLGQSWLPANSSFIPKEQNLGRGIEDVMVVISDDGKDDSNGDGDGEIMTMARTSKLCTVNGKRVKMIPLKKKKPEKILRQVMNV